MQVAGVFVDAGDIMWGKTRLPDVYSNDFQSYLTLFLSTVARTVFSPSLRLLTLFKSEAGCRIIINTYVSYAIQQARRVNNLGFIAVFPEVQVEHPQIPALGKVSGVIDYLVAKTNHRDPLRNGDIVTAVEPVLAIIEAKKSETVVQKSSMAQLLAQMFCIKHQEFQNTYGPMLSTY